MVSTYSQPRSPSSQSQSPAENQEPQLKPQERQLTGEQQSTSRPQSASRPIRTTTTAHSSGTTSSVREKKATGSPTTARGPNNSSISSTAITATSTASTATISPTGSESRQRKISVGRRKLDDVQETAQFREEEGQQQQQQQQQHKQQTLQRQRLSSSLSYWRMPAAASSTATTGRKRLNSSNGSYYKNQTRNSALGGRPSPTNGKGIDVDDTAAPRAIQARGSDSPQTLDPDLSIDSVLTALYLTCNGNDDDQYCMAPPPDKQQHQKQQRRRSKDRSASSSSAAGVNKLLGQGLRQSTTPTPAVSRISERQGKRNNTDSFSTSGGATSGKGGSGIPIFDSISKGIDDLLDPAFSYSYDGEDHGNLCKAGFSDSVGSSNLLGGRKNASNASRSIRRRTRSNKYSSSSISSRKSRLTPAISFAQRRSSLSPIHEEMSNSTEAAEQEDKANDDKNNTCFETRDPYSSQDRQQQFTEEEENDDDDAMRLDVFSEEYVGGDENNGFKLRAIQSRYDDDERDASEVWGLLTTNTEDTERHGMDKTPLLRSPITNDFEEEDDPEFLRFLTSRSALSNASWRSEITGPALGQLSPTRGMTRSGITSAAVGPTSPTSDMALTTARDDAETTITGAKQLYPTSTTARSIFSTASSSPALITIPTGHQRDFISVGSEQTMGAVMRIPNSSSNITESTGRQPSPPKNPLRSCLVTSTSKSTSESAANTTKKALLLTQNHSVTTKRPSCTTGLLSSFSPSSWDDHHSYGYQSRATGAHSTDTDTGGHEYYGEGDGRSKQNHGRSCLRLPLYFGSREAFESVSTVALLDLGAAGSRELSAHDTWSLFPKTRLVSNTATTTERNGDGSATYPGISESDIASYLQDSRHTSFRSGIQSLCEYEYDSGIHMSVVYERFGKNPEQEMKLVLYDSPPERRTDGVVEYNKVVIMVEVRCALNDLFVRTGVTT